jgi:hypothetical protein
MSNLKKKEEGKWDWGGGTIDNNNWFIYKMYLFMENNLYNKLNTRNNCLEKETRSRKDKFI